MYWIRLNQKKTSNFISGHFNNFELMAMAIEKSSINLPLFIDL